MKISVRELSERLNGTVEGDPDRVVTHPAKIEEGDEGAICFIANPKYLHFAYQTKASAIILNADTKLAESLDSSIIRVPDAYSAFSQVLEWYQSNGQQETGISQFAFIDPTAEVADEVFIGPMVYVGPRVKVAKGARIFSHAYLGHDVSVGADTTLHSGVRVYHDCKIGEHCILHAGCIIGSDGFGFAPQEDGTYKKIPQTGNVVIDDRVEIGANTTIDRATIGSTYIGKGVKIDNLVQIAHNVQIGDHSVIAAQAGISGSTKIGRYCMIGGQVGLVGHIEIADFTKINAQSGVSKSVKEPNSKLTGSPAYDYTAMLRAQAVFRRLPELEQRIRDLEAQLQQKHTNNNA